MTQRRVKIELALRGSDSKVVDAATGEAIEGIRTIHVRTSYDSITTADIELLPDRVAIEAMAEIIRPRGVVLHAVYTKGGQFVEARENEAEAERIANAAAGRRVVRMIGAIEDAPA